MHNLISVKGFRFLFRIQFVFRSFQELSYLDLGFPKSLASLLGHGLGKQPIFI